MEQYVRYDPNLCMSAVPLFQSNHVSQGNVYPATSIPYPPASMPSSCGVAIERNHRTFSVANSFPHGNGTNNSVTVSHLQDSTRLDGNIVPSSARTSGSNVTSFGHSSQVSSFPLYSSNSAVHANPLTGINLSLHTRNNSIERLTNLEGHKNSQNALSNSFPFMMLAAHHNILQSNSIMANSLGIPNVQVIGNNGPLSMNPVLDRLNIHASSHYQHQQSSPDVEAEVFRSNLENLSAVNRATFPKFSNDINYLGEGETEQGSSGDTVEEGARCFDSRRVNSKSARTNKKVKSHKLHKECESSQLAKKNSSTPVASVLQANGVQSSSCVDQSSSKAHSRNKSSLYAATNVFIAGLPIDFDECRLKALFSTFGPIESWKVMIDIDSGVSKGFGFVRYQNPDDANRAIASMNGKRLSQNCTRALYVTLAQHDGSSSVVESERVYIRNVPLWVDETDLYQVFCTYGEILECKILRHQNSAHSSKKISSRKKKYKDKVADDIQPANSSEGSSTGAGGSGSNNAASSNFNGASKGVAFVRYRTIEEARNAVEKAQGTRPFVRDTSSLTRANMCTHNRNQSSTTNENSESNKSTDDSSNSLAATQTKKKRQFTNANLEESGDSSSPSSFEDSGRAESVSRCNRSQQLYIKPLMVRFAETHDARIQRQRRCNAGSPSPSLNTSTQQKNTRAPEITGTMTNGKDLRFHLNRQSASEMTNAVQSLYNKAEGSNQDEEGERRGISATDTLDDVMQALVHTTATTSATQGIMLSNPTKSNPGGSSDLTIATCSRLQSIHDYTVLPLNKECVGSSNVVLSEDATYLQWVTGGCLKLPEGLMNEEGLTLIATYVATEPETGYIFTTTVQAPTESLRNNASSDARPKTTHDLPNPNPRTVHQAMMLAAKDFFSKNQEPVQRDIERNGARIPRNRNNVNRNAQRSAR